MLITRYFDMLSAAGWLGFAAASVLYWRLWRSADVTRLRDMREELEKAKESLSNLRQVETRLKNKSGEQQVKLNRLESDNKDLKAAMDTLKAVNEVQSKTIERMDKVQREQTTKVEWLYGRVMQLEAEKGNLPKTPWN